VICFPQGTLHYFGIVGGRHPIPMLYTAIHLVGGDPQNSPVPLWWPKMKTWTNGPFRLNMLWVSAQDDRYSETGPPLNVGSFATLIQPMNQIVWLNAVSALVRFTALYVS